MPCEGCRGEEGAGAGGQVLLWLSALQTVLTSILAEPGCATSKDRRQLEKSKSRRDGKLM